MRPGPADHIERWPIERLIRLRQQRPGSREAILDKIAAAISKMGWTMPVLVDEEGVLIVVGHARIGAWTKLGLKSIPVARWARGWSDEEKRAYAGRQSRWSARGRSWDFDCSSATSPGARVADFDLGLIRL